MSDWIDDTFDTANTVMSLTEMKKLIRDKLHSYEKTNAELRRQNAALRSKLKLTRNLLYSGSPERHSTPTCYGFWIYKTPERLELILYTGQTWYSKKSMASNSMGLYLLIYRSGYVGEI